jgi:hypothetical protein
VAVPAQVESDDVVLLDKSWNSEDPVGRVASLAMDQQERRVGGLAMERVEYLEGVGAVKIRHLVWLCSSSLIGLYLLKDLMSRT